MYFQFIVSALALLGITGLSAAELTVPYKVEPFALQLLLDDGGANLHFSGYILVAKTDLSPSLITHLDILYKNRYGQSECGKDGCSFRTTMQGRHLGFNDRFGLFPIDAKIPVSTGISSFDVIINHVNGTKQIENNNGHGYPIQDTILLQKPQSCFISSTSQLTLVAAVHNAAAANGVKAMIHHNTAQKNSLLPQLEIVTLNLEKGKCIGQYTLFHVDYNFEGDMPFQSYVDVFSAYQSDSFNSVANIGGSCEIFQNPQQCELAAVPLGRRRQKAFSVVKRQDSPLSMSTASIATPSLDSLSSDSPTPTPTPTPSSNSTSPGTPSTTPPSTVPVPAPSHKTALGGYTMSSCWSEGTVRALSGTSTANDTMTLEKCMDFCKGYNYWGTEYGRECYCGNLLGSGSKAAPLSECNMTCGGDPTEYCGAGNRLELFATTASIVTPTGTLSHKPTISPYTMVGCWTEGAADRALGSGGTSGPDMTNEKCATFCKDYRYFGTEYGSECYCGSYLSNDSKSAPVEECNMTCAGDQFEYCGASGRLELYMNANIKGGAPEQPAAVGDFVLVGCQTEGNGTRALGGASTSGGNMTNTACAGFCSSAEYFGTEYGSECYCGGELAASSAVAPKGECSMLCAGSNVEFCGGSDRLSVYKKKPVTPPPTPGNGTSNGTMRV